MHVLRTIRMSAAVLAATLTVGALGTGVAEAARPLPKPTGLTGVVTPHANGTYNVAATWNVSAAATSYRVALIKGGTTLASTTVTDNAWSPTVTATPGSASLSVRAVAGRKPGRAATISVALPDATAPTGSYGSEWQNDTGFATITETALADNSGVAGITRVVNWNDPTAPGTDVWTSGSTTLSHTYPQTEARYVPTVTLEDAAGNVRVVDVPAIVIKDVAAPTGTFTNATATAWAKFTRVTVSQSAIGDNWTPDNLIVRTVSWGDGTTSAWTGAGPAKHVYATAGTYTPTVTLTDEAGNMSPAIGTSAVVVSADTVGPKVTVAKAKPRHSVKAWRTLRGTATDAATGVQSVKVKAVEKRGTSWFGYNAVTAKWVKAATKAKAFAKSRAIVRTTNAQHRWTAKLVGLRKGHLVAKVWATDHVQNRSVVLIRKASLTAR
jgi:5'-nucleotidase